MNQNEYNAVQMQLQKDEFNAVAALSTAYKNLPAIVDDSYPEERHYYESALHALIDKLVRNGRLEPGTRGMLVMMAAGFKSGPRTVSSGEFTALRDANHTRQKEWDPMNMISTAYRGNEFGGEVGEAVEELIAHLLNMLRLSKAAGKLQNLVKKLEREKLGIPGSRTSHAELAKELADVIICTDLIAMDAEIDLWEAVRSKFNATSEKVGLKTKIP